MRDRSRYLIWMLRLIGMLDLVAIFAVLAPRTWLARINDGLGLGEFPVAPIAGYLARCTSFWYVSYGLLLWFVSYDIGKYRALITCLAAMLIAQGAIMIGIDLAVRMPIWWTVTEGPCCAGFGIVLLALQRGSRDGERQC